MDSPHPLKSLLHHQLATDASALTHLPYILSCLTVESFSQSPHLVKWTTRITSLLHAKEAAARWVGLCLAHKTAVLSRDVLIDNAQSWLGVALPLLSRNEPLPSLKAAIRLLRVTFTAATDLAEFQRQLATPNVPKFTAALLIQGEKHHDINFLVSVVETMRQMVIIYPTLHRPSHQALSTFTFRFLNGGAPEPVPLPLQHEASRLFVSLHLTGGKVGSGNLWRKSFDETLAFAWTSFFALRTTFPGDGDLKQQSGHASPEEALLSTPLNYERLRSCVVILNDLLAVPTYRTVQLPLGTLVKFVITLLTCNADSKIDTWFDPAIRSLETSLVPKIWDLGSSLTTQLAQCAKRFLGPYFTRLTICIAVHLEQHVLPAQHLQLIVALRSLLQHCSQFASDVVSTRLMKALLPSCKTVLAAGKGSHQLNEGSMGSSVKQGKKRARNYEGAEILKLSKGPIFSTQAQSQIVLQTLEVIDLIMAGPYLASHVQSLTSRILLGMLLTLSQLPPAAVSPNPSTHLEISLKVQNLCLKLGAGTTNTMNKSLSLVAQASLLGEGRLDSHEFLELLLHPRLPPLLRSVPYVEALALLPSEESHDESELRQSLGLGVIGESSASSTDQGQNQIQSVPNHQSTLLQWSGSHSPVGVHSHPGMEVIKPTLEQRGVSSIKLQPRQPTTLSRLARDDPMNISHTNLAAGSKSNLMDVSHSSISTTASEHKEDFMDVSLLSIPTAVPAPMLVVGEDEEGEDDMPTIIMDSDSE